MVIKINVEHFSLPDAKLDLIRGKVEHLTQLAARLRDESSYVKVDLAHEESRRNQDVYECTITFFVPQDTLRAHSRSGTIETAVDEVIGKLKSQIEHYKSKISHLNERGK